MNVWRLIAISDDIASLGRVLWLNAGPGSSEADTSRKKVAFTGFHRTRTGLADGSQPRRRARSTERVPM